AANHHEVRLVQLCFDFYMIEAKPENLIGDRAYDSDPLDEELRKDGIEMIAPHRSNRSKPPTQDRRRLSRYMRRWLVEGFFAWIQWQRRILVRWEYYARNFLGFVQLACLVVLFSDFEIGSSEGRTPDAAERCVRHCAGSRPRDRDLPPRFRTTAPVKANQGRFLICRLGAPGAAAHVSAHRGKICRKVDFGL